jgi:tetratricopeptide (TPR) repeat protein
MKNYLLLFTILAGGFFAVFLLSQHLEQIKPKVDESYEDEDLYFADKQLKAFGYDARGLMADWYWINSLQYVGNKMLKVEGQLNIGDLRPLNPRLLYPMLDTASTLDPNFMTIYSYGAAVLPAIDNQQAIKLLEKGIAEHPENWRLYHNLGYIYWQTKDYEKASQIYGEGAKKADAPAWMKQMSVSMQAQGGSREFALQIYRQMFENAEDEQTKSFAELRYMQVESLIDRDGIRPILQTFQTKNGRCINTWKEIYNELRSVKLVANKTLFFDANLSPIDPLKVPYLLVSQAGKCDVDIDWKNSKVPYK